MAPGPGLAEVIDHRPGLLVPPWCVGPQVSPLGLAISLSGRLEHLHRRLVGVQDGVGKHLCAQGAGQRLELYATGAHPLRQGGAWDRHTSAGVDSLLAVRG